MALRSSVKYVFCFLLAYLQSPAEVSIPDYNKMIDSSDVLLSQVMVTDEDAYKKNAEGIAALSAEDYTRATTCFSDAFSLQPLYWDAKNNLGVLFFRTKDITSAHSIFKELAAQEPEYAVAHYNLGVIALNSRDYAQASACFKEAAKCRKNFHEALVMQCRIDLLLGNTKAALKTAENLYKQYPTQPLVWQTYAFSLIQTNDTSAAERLLIKQENSATAAQIRIMIALQKKDYTGALAAAKKAVSLGGPASIFVEISNFFIEKGIFSTALAAMQTYLETAKKPSADAWLNAGIAAKECKKKSLAKEYFQKGLSQYPDDQMLLYNCGYLYFVEKEFKKAEQTWSSLSDADRDASLLYHRALAARYSGDLLKAQSLITRALTLDQKADYYDLLGVLAYQQGNRQEAAKHFKKALAINPDLESAQLNATLLDTAPSKLPALITSAKARLDTCTADCENEILKLSVLYYKNKKIEQALAVLEQVPTKKRTEKMYSAMGFYLSELQRFDDAVAILQKAKTDLVLEQSTEMQLVDCYIKTGRTGRAMSALKELLPHWDGNPWRLYYQLGYLYFEQNKLETAQQYFERSITRMNKNPAARGMLAFIYNKMGNSQKAHALWEQTIADDPDNPSLWINIGLLYDEKGQYKEALQAYEKAYALDSTNKALCLNIGNAYAAINQHREARSAYSKALRSPQRDLAAYNSFISSQKDGEQKKADDMLKILKEEYAGSPYTQRALAEIKLSEKDTAQAVAVLEAIADKNDEDRAILAFLYIARKKIEAAQKIIELLPQTNQWHATYLQLRASLLFTQGDYNTSYSLFEALHDTSFAIAYNMALSAYNAKRYDETIRIANNHLTTTQGNDRMSLCYLAGNTYFALKKWEQALQMYTQLYGMDSQNPLTQYNIAVAYYNLDKIEQAWKYYEGARSLDKNINNKDIEMKFMAFVNKQVIIAPEDTLTSLYNNAVALQNEGNDSLAEKIYLRILQKDTLYSRAWNNLGSIYAAQSRYPESEKCYKQAIEGKDNCPEAYANLVKISLAADDIEKAKYWLMKGKTNNPQDTTIIGMDKELEESAKRK